LRAAALAETGVSVRTERARLELAGVAVALEDVCAAILEGLRLRFEDAEDGGRRSEDEEEEEGGGFLAEDAIEGVIVGRARDQAACMVPCGVIADT